MKRDEIIGLFGGEKDDISPLKVLSSLLAEFSHSLDIDETLLHVANVIKSIVHAQGVALFLLENNHSELVCRVCTGESDITGIRFGADKGIVGRSIRQGQVQLVADTAGDPDFFTGVDNQSGMRTKSILCAPLHACGEVLGALEVINKEGENGAFDENDRELMSALADAAALAIHNSRMAQQLVDEERTRHELALAREIQKSLLPDISDITDGIAGMNIPARSVSGDFYDFFKLSPDCYYFCIADVSGKGVNAALLVSQVSALFRLLAKTCASPSVLLETINVELSTRVTRGMFVTMVAGQYFPSQKRAILSNAGHQPPLQYQRETVTDYQQVSCPLGVLPDTRFEEYDVDLESGALYIFSDGLTECWVDWQKALGEQGVKRLIREYVNLPVQARLQAMLDDATRWKRETSGYLHDDITLLAIDVLNK